MWAFRAEFVATRATDFIGMIKDCDEAGFPKVRHTLQTQTLPVNVSVNAVSVRSPQHLLFASLGRSLSCADPPESERLSILNEAWKVITKVRSPRVNISLLKLLYCPFLQACELCNDLYKINFFVVMFVNQDYMSCAEIWVEFTCRHFTVSIRFVSRFILESLKLTVACVI